MLCPSVRLFVSQTLGNTDLMIDLLNRKQHRDNVLLNRPLGNDNMASMFNTIKEQKTDGIPFTY